MNSEDIIGRKVTVKEKLGEEASYLKNKSPISDFEYELFSLPKKEVIVKGKHMIHEGLAVLDVYGKTIKHQCPKCGSYRTKRIGKNYDFHEVNHMFLSNYIVLRLNIAKRRFKCLDCEDKKKKGGEENDDDKNNKGGPGGGGCTFLERFSFVEHGVDNTNTFKMFVLREWEFQSIHELSRKFRISDSVIYRMIRDVNLEDLIKERITNKLEGYFGVLTTEGVNEHKGLNDTRLRSFLAIWIYKKTNIPPEFS